MKWFKKLGLVPKIIIVSAAAMVLLIAVSVVVVAIDIAANGYEEVMQDESENKEDKVEEEKKQPEQPEEKEVQNEDPDIQTDIEKKLEKKFKKGFISLNGVFEEEPYYAQIELHNNTGTGAKNDVIDAIYIIKESGYEFENVGVSVQMPLVDKYGNESDEDVIKSDFSKETIDKLADDQSKVMISNVHDIADSWWEHPALD